MSGLISWALSNTINVVVNNPLSSTRGVCPQQAVLVLAAKPGSDFVLELQLREDDVHEIVQQIEDV